MASEKRGADFEQFQREMVLYAMSIQGDNYPGDDYYMQDCWREHFDDGDSPEDAVISDMGYWEPAEEEVSDGQ